MSVATPVRMIALTLLPAAPVGVRVVARVAVVAVVAEFVVVTVVG